MTGLPTLDDLLIPIAGTELAHELAAIRRVMNPKGPRVYLVGGLVRDLLLGRSSCDIDLAVAGSLIEVVERLTEALGGDARHHPAFLTAGLKTDAGFSVDVARLRREAYREPAALPEVEKGHLVEDLYRRDFSVNAMAVDLGRGSSRLIDFHDGLDDLAARRLRVLHPDSFRDDPTRVLRGIRLAARIGFAFDAETRRLAAAPATRAAMGRLSGFRLWRELRACFQGIEAARATVAELAALGLLAAVDPALEGVPLSVAVAGDSAPLELLAAWTAPLSRSDRWRLAERLALGRHERLALGLRPPDRSPEPRSR